MRKVNFKLEAALNLPVKRTLKSTLNLNKIETGTIKNAHSPGGATVECEKMKLRVL